MELKSLILGLLLSSGAFALKSGGGLGIVFLQAPGKTRRFLSTLVFMAGYAIVFAAAAWLLSTVDFMGHVDLVQTFFKSGMTLHFLLALLLAGWGIHLLKDFGNLKQATRGWIPLVLPCPVCFSVILLSCSFVGALYPDTPLIFLALYAGFILISLGVAICVTGLVRDPAAVRPFLGALMLFLAVYFGLSVILIPQFADLDKIYRISRNEVEMSRQIILLIILCIGAVVLGFINPFKRE
jgi:predicted transporter